MSPDATRQCGSRQKPRVADETLDLSTESLGDVH